MNISVVEIKKLIFLFAYILLFYFCLAWWLFFTPISFISSLKCTTNVDNEQALHTFSNTCTLNRKSVYKNLSRPEVWGPRGPPGPPSTGGIKMRSHVSSAILGNKIHVSNLWYFITPFESLYPWAGVSFLRAPIMVPFLVAMFLRTDVLPDANPCVAFDTQG